jgi:hypothetical protein
MSLFLFLFFIVFGPLPSISFLFPESLPPKLCLSERPCAGDASQHGKTQSHSAPSDPSLPPFHSFFDPVFMRVCVLGVCVCMCVCVRAHVFHSSLIQCRISVQSSDKAKSRAKEPLNLTTLPVYPAFLYSLPAISPHLPSIAGRVICFFGGVFLGMDPEWYLRGWLGWIVRSDRI